jgi:hypothetical protein
MPSAISFREPSGANHSENFLACHHPPSPYPRTSRIEHMRLAIKARVDKVIHHFHRRQRLETRETFRHPLIRFPCASNPFPPSVEPAEEDADGGWAAVRERIHRAGVNIAGHEITLAEQQRCVDAMAIGLECGFWVLWADEEPLVDAQCCVLRFDVVHTQCLMHIESRR